MSVEIKKYDFQTCVNNFNNIIIPDDRKISLKRYTHNGELDNKKIRSISWKFFLNIISINENPSNWITTLSKNRKEYWEKIKKLNNPKKKFSGDPLTNFQKSKNKEDWNTFYNDSDNKKLISLDIERTYQEINIFHNKKYKDMLSTILFIWSKENNKIGYKQGMNELLAVIFLSYYPYYFKNEFKDIQIEDIDINKSSNYGKQLYSFFHDEDELESDLYLTFNNLMNKGINEFFYISEEVKNRKFDFRKYELFENQWIDESLSELNTPLIKRCTSIMKEKLKYIDSELYDYLQRINLNGNLILNRWLKCIFNREFSYEKVLILWDIILINNSEDDKYSYIYIDFIAVAMFLIIRAKLLVGNNNECLTLLFKYPEINILRLIEIADNIKKIFLEKIPINKFNINQIINGIGFNRKNNSNINNQNTKTSLDNNLWNENNTIKNDNNISDFTGNTKKLFSKAFNSFGGFIKEVGNNLKKNIDEINLNKKENLELEREIKISHVDEAVLILEKLQQKYTNVLSSKDNITLQSIIDFYKNYIFK